MPIVPPVTQTVISTTQWGIPITNEVNRLTKEAYNAARGQMAYAEQGSTDIIVSDTSVVSLIAIPVFTPEAGRRYDLSYELAPFSSTPDNVIVIRVYEGGTTSGTVVLNHRMIASTAGNSNLYNVWNAQRPWTPLTPGVGVNLTLAVQRSGGSTGTFTFMARAAVDKPFLRVIDMGPLQRQ